MELLQPVSGRGVYSEINLHLGKKIFNFSQIRSGSADIHTLNKYPSSPPSLSVLVLVLMIFLGR